jgi:hypothetical protein
MRTYEDTFSGQKIYPGKVRKILTGIKPSGSLSATLRQEVELGIGKGHTFEGYVCIIWEELACVGRMAEMRSGQENGIARDLTDTPSRVNSLCAPTPRSSVFRTASQNPSSSSARTLAASPGPSCAGDSEGRVSLRYVIWNGGRFKCAIVETQATNTLLQEQAKTRRRKQVKAQRAVVGASLDVIKERRTQRPEARSAARVAAIKEGKEKRAAAQSAKKAEKAKSAAHTTGR